jgi:hypothetical protein
MTNKRKLDITYYPAGDLVPNSWNPNVVNSLTQEKIRNSLEQKDFFKPVLVRETEDEDGNTFLEIIGGQHRVQAAAELGMEVPTVNLGPISDGDAKLYGQVDNARYGEDDEDLLGRLFADGSMGDPKTLLSILPMDESELEGFFSNEVSNESLEDLLAGLNDDTNDDNSDGLNLDSSPAASNTQIIRFKVSKVDGDFISEQINRIKLREGFKESDDLTNAGDALICLLRELNGDG